MQITERYRPKKKILTKKGSTVKLKKQLERYLMKKAKAGAKIVHCEGNYKKRNNRYEVKAIDHQRRKCRKDPKYQEINKETRRNDHTNNSAAINKSYNQANMDFATQVEKLCNRMVEYIRNIHKEGD